MVNDTISDMLTRIRNANIAYQTNVSITKTKINERICEILEKEGFIETFSVSPVEATHLQISLKYHHRTPYGSGGGKQPCITNLKRISKPGLRIYTNYKEIPKILGGMGIVIISTSRGLMTDREARHARLGGELICSVW
jgi:small subunit ribosomal protein S8|uniref:Small ribosomal subunit protein uS8c n=1 Tax=Pseudochloris wilhelmii TaxID=1418016 RepID=A0A097KQT3_9CHLO|nr:ribosomal protein S8 [Pseudochloris wilhelmii]AIT95541.1 ribosomal protein S8 [Pseudochloris wilhelmii]